MRPAALIALLALSVAACGEQTASEVRPHPQAGPADRPAMTAQRQPDRPAGEGTPRSRRDGPTYNGKTY